MSDNIIIFVFVTVLIGWGLVVGSVVGKDFLREDAIKAGAAHYECNKDTGKCSFAFIKSKE